MKEKAEVLRRIRQAFEIPNHFPVFLIVKCDCGGCAERDQALLHIDHGSHSTFIELPYDILPEEPRMN